MTKRSFNGIPLTYIDWKSPDGGTVKVYVATEIGLALEYKDGRSLVQSIQDDWRDEFDEGIHFIWAEGEGAKAIARIAGWENPGDYRRLMLLTDQGLSIACLKTNKPKGKEMRRWLAHDVIPQVQAHGAYIPAAHRPIPEVAAPKDGVSLKSLEAAIAAALNPLKGEIAEIRRYMLPAGQQPLPNIPRPARQVIDRKKLDEYMKQVTGRAIGEYHGGAFGYKIRENLIRLHGEFFRRTGIDLERLSAQSKGKTSAAQAAEGLGRLDDLYALAVELFGEAA